MTAKRQCTHEMKTLLNRWENESDLSQEEICDCFINALKEYYSEEIIDFDSEIDLGEDE